MWVFLYLSMKPQRSGPTISSREVSQSTTPTLLVTKTKGPSGWDGWRVISHTCKTLTCFVCQRILHSCACGAYNWRASSSNPISDHLNGSILHQFAHLVARAECPLELAIILDLRQHLRGDCLTTHRSPDALLRENLVSIENSSRLVIYWWHSRNLGKVKKYRGKHAARHIDADMDLMALRWYRCSW